MALTRSVRAGAFLLSVMRELDSIAAEIAKNSELNKVVVGQSRINFLTIASSAAF